MQEQQIAQRTKILSYIMIVAILIGLTGYSFFNSNTASDSSRLTLHNDGSLTLTDSQNSRTTLRYADLLSVQWIEEPDWGEPTSGKIIQGVREGAWHSDTWGDYIASAEEKIPCCMMLQTADQWYAVNYESAAATKSLCASIQKFIAGS